jgi:kynurenine formamidase
MSTLLDLVKSIQDKSIEVFDLTHTLNESFPALVLPPELGQVASFKKEEVSRYDERGEAWYWNNFSVGEHFGTHFDAPAHWITGKDCKNGTVDTVPVVSFIAPANIIDASEECLQNPDFILTVDYIKAWEDKNGEIEQQTWVILRSDWYKKDFEKDFINVDENGLCHTPGPSKEAIEYLIRKNILGYGCETINTDAGLSFTWKFQLPCHTLMQGAGKYGLQCLKNLDKLPAKGSVIVASPLKIEDGSGSPLRVIALVENTNKV